MTVTTTTRSVRHIGNGSATSFPYKFKIENAVDANVVVETISTGARNTLLSSQYTITGLGDNAGGSVTYPTSGDPLGSDKALIIYREVDYTQDMNITNESGFFPEVLEDQLDDIVFQVQQVADSVNRSLRVPVGDAIADLGVPAVGQRAGKALVFDDNGDIALQDLAISVADAVYSNRSAATAASIDADVDFFIIAGHTTPGDKGGGLFMRNTDAVTRAADIVSADGARWQLVPIGDKVYPEQFGAFDNGLDMLTPLTNAIQYAIDEDVTLDLGTSTFLIGNSSKADITPTLEDGDNVRIVGQGATIKELEGTSDARGISVRMLGLHPSGAITIKDVHIEGIVFDHSGSTVTTPSPTTKYEQAHCLSLSATNGAIFERVTLKDVITKDKVGGGIVFAAGQVNDGYLENCHGIDFNYGGLQRGDLEFQSTVNNLRVLACSGKYVQSEPNASTPFGGGKPHANFLACRYDTFDLVGYSGALESQTYELVDCYNGDAGTMWCHNAFIYTKGGRLRQGSGTDWRNVQGVIDGTTIVLPYDSGANAMKSLNINSTSLVKIDLEFRDLRFMRDASAVGTSATSAAVDNSGVVADADIDKYLVRFVDVDFEDGFESTADCYRNGKYEFIRCKLVSRSGIGAVRVGGDATATGRIVLEDCDLTRVAGELVDVPGAGATSWSITFRGRMDYAKATFRGRPATEYQDSKVTHEAVWLANTRPASKGLNGMLVRHRKPAIGAAHEWMCSTGNVSGAATFVFTGQAGVAKGATGSRPTLNANDIGLLYLDTTLDVDGKPIWWNGSAWVDATGATV